MTDNDIIKQCLNGDHSAFEKLLERHYDSIYRIAYHWCNNQTNAQDITQLTCIKLAKTLKSFHFKSTFTSWLYSCVINTAKDFYKSPTQRNIREEQINNLEELTPTNTDTAEINIHTQQIFEKINLLSDDLKDAIVLVFANGLNHHEAAKKLGIKESTVSWRIHEARKQLKGQFQSSTLNYAGETS